MASVARRERRLARRAETLAATDVSPVSLVASAVNVRVTQGWQNVRWGGTDWQQEAWMHYDTCPEFHAGVNIGANNLSRARLIGVSVNPETGEPGTQATDDPDVVDLMSNLFGGPTGQSQALSMLYRHLDVAGDCWALGTDNPDLDLATWEILATTEVQSAGGGRVTVEQINGLPRLIDTERELLMRIWQPHPKRRWEADASARALLPVLRELASLTAMVSATVKSRLASAGILWIPEELTLPAPRTTQPNDISQVRNLGGGNVADSWLDLITEAMTAPIRDPDSASAVVPLVSVVKGAEIANIKHMEFGKDLDAMIEPLREACVKRLAIGMNLPVEILLGLGSVNHWTAWAITEDYAKAYLAPKLELICDAVTRFYLHPALRMRGRDPKQFAVYFNIEALYPKQITVENADKAWGAGLLAETEYMEILGFSKAQIADNKERARRLITELLQRGNPQTLAEVAGTIALLFPGIEVQPLTATGGLGKAITGEPATPAAPHAAHDGTEGAGTPAPNATPATNAPPAITAGPPTTTPSNAAGG